MKQGRSSIIFRNWVLIPLFLISQGILLFTALMPLKGRTAAKLFSGPLPHLAAFFITAMLACMILDNFKIKIYYIIGLLYSFCVSIFVEYLQEYLTSYRSFEKIDIFYGTLGAFSFVVLDRIIYFVFRKK